MLVHQVDYDHEILDLTVQNPPIIGYVLQNLGCKLMTSRLLRIDKEVKEILGRFCVETLNIFGDHVFDSSRKKGWLDLSDTERDKNFWKIGQISLLV